MTASAQDPLAGFRLGDSIRDHGDHFVPVLDVHQIEVQLGPADAREVGMALDETGNRERAVQIDHCG